MSLASLEKDNTVNTTEQQRIFKADSEYHRNPYKALAYGLVDGNPLTAKWTEVDSQLPYLEGELENWEDQLMVAGYRKIWDVVTDDYDIWTGVEVWSRQTDPEYCIGLMLGDATNEVYVRNLPSVLSLLNRELAPFGICSQLHFMRQEYERIKDFLIGEDGVFRSEELDYRRRHRDRIQRYRREAEGREYQRQRAATAKPHTEAELRSILDKLKAKTLEQPQ